MAASCMAVGLFGSSLTAAAAMSVAVSDGASAVKARTPPTFGLKCCLLERGRHQCINALLVLGN